MRKVRVQKQNIKLEKLNTRATFLYKIPVFSYQVEILLLAIV
jgi:hypothetical protein